MFWYRDFQARWEKLCHENWKMDCISRIMIPSFEACKRKPLIITAVDGSIF